jgi:hypothetical protein
MRGLRIVGWTAVGLGTFAASFWAFWGTIEAFHEGWCKPLLWMRLLQLLAYLTPTMGFTTLTVVGIRWPRVGAALYGLVGIAIGALIVIDQAEFPPEITFCITVLPILLALMFFFGDPAPKRRAYVVSVGLPLMIVAICGVEPVIRVSARFNDGDRRARLVAGNGVALIWAPAGPGWSREGNVTWGEAVERARHLTSDGGTLAKEPQDTWRLPSRSEVVRSLTRDNRNASGTWDPHRGRARYQRRPDKESPLWDPFAPLIYLWTSDEVDEETAWIVVYHGGVYEKPKGIGSPSFGFRAVRAPDEEEVSSHVD